MAKVSWMWGGKRHYGTLIRETKTHKFARTVNGKVKKIKRKLNKSVAVQKKNTRQLQGSALVKKEDWCKLELHQCHNFHQNVAKGVMDKFDLLLLFEVENNWKMLLL